MLIGVWILRVPSKNFVNVNGLNDNSNATISVNGK